MQTMNLNSGSLNMGRYANSCKTYSIVLGLGLLCTVLLNGCAPASTAQNDPAQRVISTDDIAQFMKLSDIGFQKDDERLSQKKQHLNDAAKLINAGNANQALAALDKADALMPVEVADFSSWPFRDTLACKSSPIKNTLTDCAVQFESGQMTCGNPKAASLAKACVAYYCESELYKEGYSDPHDPYLTVQQMDNLKSVNAIIGKTCAPM
jgi:hypothetical protein